VSTGNTTTLAALPELIFNERFQTQFGAIEMLLDVVE
jgi:hypothetical protein